MQKKDSRFVYLFELDSVRKTDKEIIAGQKALFYELVHRGNIVVLTFNQLVDSRAFFSLLHHQEYYDSFVTLFKEGRIRISQYGEIRTISQYLLNSIEPKKEFIYSALPIKSSQRRLTALMRRSLVYSDLSEISHYLEKSCPEEELRDLFTEAATDDSGKLQIFPSELSSEEMRKILDYLSDFLSLILRLSAIHTSYIPPRDSSEIRNLKLSAILQRAVTLTIPSPLWNQAAASIKVLPAFQTGSNNRSVYLNDLRDLSLKQKDNRSVLQYAEAIIDLCFNYACEISICDTSKRYDAQELLNPDQPAVTFQQDFQSRLDQYWNQGEDADARFLQPETNEFHEFSNEKVITDFSSVIRLLSYQGKKETVIDLPGTEVFRYDWQSEKQEKAQKRSLLASMGKKFLFTLLCFSIAIILQLVFQNIQTALDSHVSEPTVLSTILETILFLLLSEWISSLIASHWEGFLSLSEAMSGIAKLFQDGFSTLKWRIKRTHSENMINKAEPLSSPSVIRFITPPEIRKYCTYASENTDLFSDLERSRIVNLNEKGITFSVIRQEELTNQSFGLIYQSNYNILLVDPIRTESNLFTPYERVIPTAGNGVVIVVMCGGKLVLLNQYRHALQDHQYSFPRGYAEPGQSSIENVARELKEELNAEPSETPVYLGKVSPDSGLTSRMTEIYFVLVNSYLVRKGYEGICSVIEVDETELKKMINDHSINDSYTIAAYELYCLKKKKSIILAKDSKDEQDYFYG